jgi:photosystem II stability/assembly factor-like uncharacterized protein
VELKNEIGNIDINPSNTKTIISRGRYLATSLNSNNTGTGIYYSLDGINWNQTNQTTDAFLMVCYVNGRYFASKFSGGIYYSTDEGMTWSLTNQTTIRFFNMIYHNGKYICSSIGSGIYYSTDGGMTWQ